MNKTWQDLAPCKNKGAQFFSENIIEIRKAKSLCRKCQFAAECLQLSINQEELFGVWGGLSQRERRKYHRMFSGGIDIKIAKEIVLNHGNDILAQDS